MLSLLSCSANEAWNRRVESLVSGIEFPTRYGFQETVAANNSCYSQLTTENIVKRASSISAVAYTNRMKLRNSVNYFIITRVRGVFEVGCSSTLLVKKYWRNTPASEPPYLSRETRYMPQCLAWEALAHAALSQQSRRSLRDVLMRGTDTNLRDVHNVLALVSHFGTGAMMRLTVADVELTLELSRTLPFDWALAALEGELS